MRLSALLLALSALSALSACSGAARHGDPPTVPPMEPLRAQCRAGDTASCIDALLIYRDGEARDPLLEADLQPATVGLAWLVTSPLIERLRDDENILAAGMTVSQLISVGIFLAGLAFWAWLAAVKIARLSAFRTPIQLLR